ncbi:MAG: RnfH family protein [Tatlockia sp.]|nr:RnfH family protein [Tatlockia sp.]
MVLVELVYAPENAEPVHLHLSLKPGSTVADVLEASGIFLSHPEVKGMPVGIFSKQVIGEHLIRAGDRVEIYRPLTIDPMEKRRQRAKLKN